MELSAAAMVMISGVVCCDGDGGATATRLSAAKQSQQRRALLQWLSGVDEAVFGDGSETARNFVRSAADLLRRQWTLRCGGGEHCYYDDDGYYYYYGNGDELCCNGEASAAKLNSATELRFGNATPPTSVTPKNSLPTYLSSFIPAIKRVSREGSLPNGGKDEQFTHLLISRIRRLSRDSKIQEGRWIPPYPLSSKVCSSGGGFRASITSIPTSTPSLKSKRNSLMCFLFLNSAFSASSTSAALFRSHKKNMDSSPLSWFSFSIYTLPIILATLSLLEVTKILLPGCPSLREFFNGSHFADCSVHTSSITSRNLFPDKVLLIFSSKSWSWDNSVELLVIDSTMAFAILIWSKGQERAATCLGALDLLSQTSGSPLIQNIVHLVAEVFDIFDPELDAIFLKASLLCIIQYLPDILEL
nr:hypothetical protein CFOL_v3_32523 [Ipomoea batatas]